MFWGVTLESGKRYSQVVDTSYHLSMAALEPKHGGEPVMVMLEHGKAEFLLCTLDQAQTRQVPLDLNFVEGEEVTFFLNGKGTVHLTGYITDGLQDDDDDDGESSSSGDEDVSLPDEEEEEAEDEEFGMGDAVAPPARRAIQRKKNKPSLLQALNGDDSEEDSDFDVDQVEDATEDDDDNDEEEEEDSDDEEPKPAQVQKRPPLKRPALMALGRSDSKPTAEQTSPGPGDGVSKKKRKRNKKGHTDGATADSEGPKSPTLGGGPAGQGGTTLPGGVICTDLRVGSGPVAKHGKSVHVYYTGRLANNRVFDNCLSGKAFCFRLGKNEVIKGWETGIQGMKVGGKRRLVVPPSQGYGSTRMGTIPPNSTLYFDVELKAVS